MKNLFKSYYPPTAEEYQRLWKEATIVLDTNVLLNLYRLPSTARDEFLTVLELLKDRLWIPHQVALEFHRRRLTVIATERKSTEDALGSAEVVIGDLRKKVDALQIDKRGLGIDTGPILEGLQKANEKLVSAIEAAHNSQQDIASSDPIRDRLDNLLLGRVGMGPQSQGELDLLVQNGDDRFREKIPPGFADIDKDKNPNEATFIHEHLKYQRKFGDLILWRQLLSHAKSEALKCVLLVTADRKEDWWWREQGKTIGAHPELLSEIKRESAIELFWMYSSVQFVEHANKYTAASVSTQAVEELQQIVTAAALIPAESDIVSQYKNIRNLLGHSDRNNASSQDRLETIYTEALIYKWLSDKFENVIHNPEEFPDFIVYSDFIGHGFEIKYIQNFNRSITSPNIRNAMRRGYQETMKGKISRFTMILVVPEFEFLGISIHDQISEINQKLGKILLDYPIHSIIVGSVIEGKFEILTQRINFKEGYDEDPSGN